MLKVKMMMLCSGSNLNTSRKPKGKTLIQNHGPTSEPIRKEKMTQKNGIADLY